MSIKGILDSDERMKEVDRILDILAQCDQMFDDALFELTNFFIRHLKTGLIPINSLTQFSSPIQKRVYEWIDSKFQHFCKFLNSTELPITEKTKNTLQKLLINDNSKSIIPAAAHAFITNHLFADDSKITSIPEFQNLVYGQLLPLIPENSMDLALNLLTHEFPNPQPSKEFTSLFLKFVSIENLPESSMIQILENFDSVLSRVHDKIDTYDFINNQFTAGPFLASLSLPYMVIIASSKAVDSPNFYEVAFNAISPTSLNSIHRMKFLEMLIQVLSPKSRPAPEVMAFAVKLSRMLPQISLDAQMDVLSVLQTLSRRHECIIDLLSPTKPEDGGMKISDVYGPLDQCQPETLWEVRSFQCCATNAIAEEAKTIGQRWLPPDFMSFKLADAVNNIKPRPRDGGKPTNWCANLDQTLWDLH